MFRTLLIDLPFTSVHRPNLALTLLQGALRAAGQACDLRYAKLDFGRQIGVDLYRVISEQLPQELLIGDFIFGELLHGSTPPAFIERAHRQAAGRERVPADLWDLLPELRARATRFLEALADETALADYDLVGLNLTFQIAPAIAFARLLKARDPEVRIVLGGGNCEDELGATLHQQFSWIDFVSRGEGESLLVDLVMAHTVQRQPRDGRSLEADLSRIQGLIWRDGARSIANGVRAENVRQLDAWPSPDYRDFFAQLERSAIGLRPAELSIPFETSRGCWFGTKMHCTFCGLNGPSLEFRSKPATRVLEELRAIADSGVPNADAVDLILDMKYFDTLLPALAEERLDLAIFFEVKSNLTRAQVRKLAAAGFSSVQPGIESLSSATLSLMRKGVSAYQNVRLLKWLAEAGINVQWNLLYGFPREEPGQYEQIAALIPGLVHLQPPAGGCMRVLLNRFSPLFFDAERLGVRHISPVAGYGQIFGAWCGMPERLAYYFDFDPEGGPSEYGYVEPLRKAVTWWRSTYGKAVFVAVDREGALTLYDTRPGAAATTATLTGTERFIYMACDDGGTVAAISQKAQTGADATQEVLERFVTRRWVMHLDGRYVSLAVPVGDRVPAGTPPSLWPAVGAAQYRRMAQTFIEQDGRANFVPTLLAGARPPSQM